MQVKTDKVVNMLDKLDAMVEFHRQVLNIRDKRQRILAINIANSDTPNYQARDINFNAELSKALKQESGFFVTNTALNVTAANHIAISKVAPSDHALLYRTPYQASADNNTVDMDKERVEMADNSVRYQGSLIFIREQFKHLVSVLQQG